MGHYIRPNEKVWTPGSVIFVDSEAWRTPAGGGEDQTLRLWRARLDDRRPRKRGTVEHLTAGGTTGPALAAQVDAWTVQRPSAWLYTHNIGYDLTLTCLIPGLCATGWAVSFTSAHPAYLFLTLTKGQRTLTVTDSHHLLPMPLDGIGTLVGLDKSRMPPQDAGDDAWGDYCARDVDVLATAVLALMDHWDGNQLGRWTTSGAANGFRALRHMLPPKSITVFDDPDGSANDRAAIYGGRRSCGRLGEQPPGRYSELDFTAAHATTAASYPMPVKRGPWFGTLPPHHKAIDGHYAYVIAECDVETDVPRFPKRAGDRVWYPVGRFTTVLASPEIAWARDLGCLRRIGPGQFHYTSTALAPFFQRVLDSQHATDEAVPPIAKAMWKQWGRSVAGKFAQPGYVTRDTGQLTDKIWYYEQAIDAETGKGFWRVHYGGHIHDCREEGESGNAYPAVLAVIESYERVALGKAIEMLGHQAVVQYDTDGLWADMGAIEAGHVTNLGFSLADVTREARCDLAVDVVNQQLGALQLREKTTVNKMIVVGPQDYEVGGRATRSGCPRKASRIADGKYLGDTFPGVAWQQANSRDGVFRVETVTWTQPACSIPAWVLSDLTTAAVEVRDGLDGQAVIVPWCESRHAARGARLGPHQNADLTGLWDPATDTEVNTSGKPVIWDRTREAAAADRIARRREAGLAVTPPGLPPVRRQPRVHQASVPSRPPTPERVERGGARPAGSEDETIT